MPFTNNQLLAPQFVTPQGDRQDHQPPVVSIVPTGGDVSDGIRLHHNQDRRGYILAPEVEGFGVAEAEITSADLASGGAVFRHDRLVSGDMFLPIWLSSPVPSALPGMFDALVGLVRPGRGELFDVVVYDPYTESTRTRRLIYQTGLEDVSRFSDHLWKVGITAQFMDPYWYGVERVLERNLGALKKKFITASEGSVVAGTPEYKWEGGVTEVPTITHEWAGESNHSVSYKLVRGVRVATNHVVNPSFKLSVNGWITSRINNFNWTIAFPQMWGRGGGFAAQFETNHASSVTLSAAQPATVVAGQFVGLRALVANEAGNTRLQLKTEDAANTASYQTNLFTDAAVYDGAELVEVFEVPAGAVRATLQIQNRDHEIGDKVWVSEVQMVVTDTEVEAYDQVQEYFDGDSPGSEFEFISKSESVKLVNGVEVGRNYHENPQGLIAPLATYHPGDGEYTEELIHGTDGPLPDVQSYRRATVTTPATNVFGWRAQNPPYRTDMTVGAGQTVTVSWWLRYTGSAAEAMTTPRIYFGSEYYDGAEVVLPSGEWVRASITRQSVSGSSTVGWWSLSSGKGVDAPTGSTLDITAIQVERDGLTDYFDGGFDTERENGYEFPFFPILIGGSTIQNQYELQVEGDAPAWWEARICGPGTDLQIKNHKGEQIFVPSAIDECVNIVTKPQEEDITLDDGTPIWDRIPIGKDVFFPLQPGKNLVNIVMVGANPMSMITIKYREAFYHPWGGGR